MKFSVTLFVVFFAFLVAIEAKPKKEVVAAPDVEEEVVPDVETVPVKNATNAAAVDDLAVADKVPALGKPEKDGEKGGKKPTGDEEAITGFFEEFFDCLYKAIEKWFPSDEESSSEESSEDDDEEEEEDEDTVVAKPTTKKAPIVVEDVDEKKKK